MRKSAAKRSVSVKLASHRTRLTLRYGYGNGNYAVTADDYVTEVTARVPTENERKYNRRLGQRAGKLKQERGYKKKG